MLGFRDKLEFGMNIKKRKRKNELHTQKLISNKYDERKIEPSTIHEKKPFNNI